ncbi:hypothetical protein M3Y97_01104800 [Aphelenchoides bicaudatus]|nr:hypothetical protein M3Y97_01104800 [Aphelenchoides bicaudatus]
MFDGWHEISLFAITLITLLLQVYVIYMITFQTPNNMRDYLYFLLLLTVIDLLFTIVVGIYLQPSPLPFLAVQAKGVCSYFSEFACVVGASASLALGACTLMIQIYCLMYRCAVLFRTKRIYRLFVSIPAKVFFFTFGLSVAFGFGYFFYRSDYRRNEVPMHPTVEMEYKNLTAILKPTDALLFIDIYDNYVMAYVATLGSCLFLSEFVSLLMVIGILSFLRKNAALFSRVTYRLHVQFTILLAVQLTSPFVLIIIPAAIYVISLIVHHNDLNELYVKAGFNILTLYGFINGGCTLIFVGPYRKRAKQQLIDPILKLLGAQRKSYVVPQDFSAFDDPHCRTVKN